MRALPREDESNVGIECGVSNVNRDSRELSYFMDYQEQIKLV